MRRKKSINLAEEIRQFRKKKWQWGVGLILVGLLGLIIPFIPGLLFLGLGIWLLFPRDTDKFIRKFKKSLKSNHSPR